MSLLIDGYNLLHATGLFGPPSSGGSFEASRKALLQFLAESLEEAERRRTTIVFDATDAPPGLPRTASYRGISIHYAQGYPDADALLEQLISADTSPRKLTVVSSDHRVQRAAKRRRAAAVDSEIWYADLWRRRRRAPGQEEGAAARPDRLLSPEEVERWLRELGVAPSSGDDPPPGDPPLFPPGCGEEIR